MINMKSLESTFNPYLYNFKSDFYFSVKFLGFETLCIIQVLRKKILRKGRQ